MAKTMSSARTAFCAVLMTGTLVALAACSNTAPAGTSSTGASNGGQQQTLTVLHKWPEPQHEAYWNQIVKGFEAEHPGVKVEMTAVQDDPYKEKLKVLTASKTLPDVYFAWPGKYGEQYYESGLAADLTSAMGEDGWGDSLTPAALDAYTDDGHVYGVPITLDGKFMIYNTKVFADNGVTVPKTLDDLLSVCSTLKGKGIEPIAFGNQAGWPAVHYLTTLIAKYVPDDVVARDFDPKTATFTDPGYRQALETLGTLSDQCFPADSNGISNDSAKAEVQTGVAAMGYFESNNFSIFTADGGASQEVADNWSFFAFPSIPDGNGDDTALTGAPDGFLVNPNSSHVDLAIEFLRYLTSADGGKAMYEVFGRPSAVIDSDQGVDITPQLQQAVKAINSAPHFSMWLDTATVSEVAQAFLAGAQAAVDHSQTSDQIMDNVIAASKSASS